MLKVILRKAARGCCPEMHAAVGWPALRAVRGTWVKKPPRGGLALS